MNFVVSAFIDIINMPQISEKSLEQKSVTKSQGVKGVETLIRALWFSCDAEQDWN